MSRLARVLCAMAACLLALAGCTTLADLGELRTALEDAGYDVSNIDHSTNNGYAVLSISAVSEEGAPADVDRIAELIWTKFPGEIDELAIALDGGPARVASADELTEKFGERPADLTAKEEDSGSDVVAVAVILAGAAVLTGILVLVWRNGRRPPPRAYAPQQYPRR